MTKTCRACGIEKPITEFYPRRQDKQFSPDCKSCISVKNAEKYREDPERYKKRSRSATHIKGIPRAQYEKIWRERNAERLAQASRDRYLSDPPEIRKAKNAERNKKNAAQRAEYRRKNKLAIQAKDRRYRRTALAKRKADQHRRRARLRNAPGSFSAAEWEAVKAQQDYRCLMCGLCEPLIRLTVDHVVPLALGGSNFADNLQGLCHPCNSSKGATIIDLRKSIA
jgi:5-methylcytosine-specific restriction endonuclease McrA